MSRKTLKQLLQESYEGSTVRTNGRSTIKETTIEGVKAKDVSQEVSIKVPHGSEVYFQSRISRDDWKAIIFLGDWSGSVVYASAIPGKSGAAVDPILRGELLDRAKSGETELFPDDYLEVREQRRHRFATLSSIRIH